MFGIVFIVAAGLSRLDANGRQTIGAQTVMKPSHQRAGLKPDPLQRQIDVSSLPRVEGNPFAFAAANGEGPLPRLPEAWENIRASAGLEDVRLHDLRHNFASVGAASGDSLLIIGRLLGHKNASSTERYSHLSDDPLRSTATRIGARIMAALDGNARAEVARLGKTTTHR